ncbi:MAG: hypothetical protein WC708_14425 [Lentisphaeria bacterium]
MRALFAIMAQTWRSSLRLRVFHLLLVLSLLVVLVVPVTVKGDGTAAGDVQILLTYTLGMLTAMISAAALWIACAGLSREIEGYQVHLVVSTPVPRWRLWLGKWLGVATLHGLLLGIGAATVFGLLHWRLAHGIYADEELKQVRSEVLAGRREYLPWQPNFLRLAEDEYQKRVKTGDFGPDHNPVQVRAEIMRQLRARATELPPGASRFWVYRGVRKPADDALLHLRYRHYIGSSSSRTDQKFTEGVWAVRDPAANEDSFAALPQRVMSGAFHEIVLPGKMVAPDGQLVAGYTNLDQERTPIMFQPADGPFLLAPETGFLNNYLRAVFLAFLQVAFLAAIGCVFGGIFSTPVALFVSAMYLVIGLLVQSAVRAPLQDEFGRFQYQGLSDRIPHYVALATRALVVSVDDFDATGDLARGRLVTWEKLGGTIGGLLGLRTLPLVALGVWILTRRELGTVVRT